MHRSPPPWQADASMILTVTSLCDKEPICTNQTISAQATEVLIYNLSWLL